MWASYQISANGNTGTVQRRMKTYLLVSVLGRHSMTVTQNKAKPQWQWIALATFLFMLGSAIPAGQQAYAFVTVTPDRIITTDGDRPTDKILDVIPNFGGHPTIVSTGNGNWSNPAIWSLKRAPMAGDVVSIAANTTVSYDTVSTDNIDTVVIQNGGTLAFRTDITTKLMVTNVLVLPGGTFQAGTAANPVAANVKAEIVLADTPLDTKKDPAQYGHSFLVLGGKVTMYGAQKTSFVRLAAPVKAGDPTLTFVAPVIGWLPGDTLVLPDSRGLVDTDRGVHYVNQTERVHIAGVSADGRTVTLSTPALFAHSGPIDMNGQPAVIDASITLDGVGKLEPFVMDITRNLVLHSQKATQDWRGYFMVTDRADANIQYAQFSGLGRTQLLDKKTGAILTPIDNTTFDVNGNVTHVGTNQSGRYPVYFNGDIGPAVTPADGYQATFVGNSIFCPLDPMPFKDGLFVRNTHYSLFRGNVIFNWVGAGVVGAPEGNESYNVWDSNYVLEVGGTDARTNNDNQGNAFWFRSFGQGTKFINNVAADGKGTAAYSYGITISPTGMGISPSGVKGDVAYALGKVQIPASQGARPSVTVDPIATLPIPAGNFNKFEVSNWNGASIWNLGAHGGDMTANYAGSFIQRLIVENPPTWGLYMYPTNNFTADYLTVIASQGFTHPDKAPESAYHASDYIQGGHGELNHILAHGTGAGIVLPRGDGKGTIVVENGDIWPAGSRQQPGVAVRWTTPWSVNGGGVGVTGVGPGLAPTFITVKNVKFGPPPAIAIGLNFGSGGNDYITPNQLCFSNGNNAAEVFFAEQAFNAIVPPTGPTNIQYKSNPLFPYALDPAGINPNGTYKWDGQRGLPRGVFGLTNAQAWAKYHIAIGGQIVPTTAKPCSSLAWFPLIKEHNNDNPLFSVPFCQVLPSCPH